MKGTLFTKNGEDLLPWDITSILERVRHHFRVWEITSRPNFDVIRILEPAILLRFILELHVLEIYQQITKKPVQGGDYKVANRARQSSELDTTAFDEMLVEVETRIDGQLIQDETFTFKYKPLQLEDVKKFKWQLDTILHATIAFHPNAISYEFWDCKVDELKAIADRFDEI